MALELMRRSDYNTSIYYWKDRFGKEVDFVVKAGDTVRELIQVCYDSEHPDTKAREVNALLRASEELKCDEMTVLTGGYEGEERIKGKVIKFVPLWTYLLKPGEEVRLVNKGIAADMGEIKSGKTKTVSHEDLKKKLKK
jgi:predicted AAA+ superfamily ATPase